MSETIQVALITFSSGAIGAIAGVVGGYISAKCAAKAEMEKAVLSAFFEKRVAAYTQVYQTFPPVLSCSKGKRDTDAVIALACAINSASLVASRETADALTAFALALSNYDFDSSSKEEKTSFDKAKEKAFNCMERDMRTFDIPTIRPPHPWLRALRRWFGKGKAKQ